jgi:hypothetical protein
MRHNTQQHSQVAHGTQLQQLLVQVVLHLLRTQARHRLLLRGLCRRGLVHHQESCGNCSSTGRRSRSQKGRGMGAL